MRGENPYYLNDKSIKDLHEEDRLLLLKSHYISPLYGFKVYICFGTSVIYILDTYKVILDFYIKDNILTAEDSTGNKYYDYEHIIEALERYCISSPAM